MFIDDELNWDIPEFCWPPRERIEEDEYFSKSIYLSKAAVLEKTWLEIQNLPEIHEY